MDYVILKWPLTYFVLKNGKNKLALHYNFFGMQAFDVQNFSMQNFGLKDAFRNAGYE